MEGEAESYTLGAGKSLADEIADLETDGDLLDAAREAADHLLDKHPQQVEKHLERWLGGRYDYLKA